MPNEVSKSANLSEHRSYLDTGAASDSQSTVLPKPFRLCRMPHSIWYDSLGSAKQSGYAMANFLTSFIFGNFFLPIIIVILGIYIKIVSRNDQHKAFKKEDFAVGFEIALGGIFAFITQSVSIAGRISTVQDAAVRQTLENKIIEVPYLLMLWIIGLWGISTLVRKMGWEGEEKLHPIYGIIIPVAFGFVTMIFVINWISI